jgi:hypothetical protein
LWRWWAAQRTSADNRSKVVSIIRKHVQVIESLREKVA